VTLSERQPPNDPISTTATTSSPFLNFALYTPNSTDLSSIAFPETIESFAVADSYSLEHPALEAIKERALKAPLSAHAWGPAQCQLQKPVKLAGWKSN
jgi:hypothetical protein